MTHRRNLFCCTHCSNRERGLPASEVPQCRSTLSIQHQPDLGRHATDQKGVRLAIQRARSTAMAMLASSHIAHDTNKGNTEGNPKCCTMELRRTTTPHHNTPHHTPTIHVTASQGLLHEAPTLLCLRSMFSGVFVHLPHNPKGSKLSPHSALHPGCVSIASVLHPHPATFQYTSLSQQHRSPRLSPGKSFCSCSLYFCLPTNRQVLLLNDSTRASYLPVPANNQQAAHAPLALLQLCTCVHSNMWQFSACVAVP
jgi:hypothetical protein